jgi:hypothetical protein
LSEPPKDRVSFPKGSALLRSGGRFANPEHDDFRADRRAVVEIDDILDMARQIAKSREGRTSRRLRKKVDMLPISNAFSSLAGSDYEDRMVAAMTKPPQAGETDTDAEHPASLRGQS